MWEKLKEIKKWVVEKVLWAEKEMAGKSGKEKRAAVVAKLDELIVLPFWLEWADGPVIGWLVDLCCEKLNWLFGHDWKEAALDETQKSELAECLTASIPKATGAQTVDERLEQLCKEYGVEYAPQIAVAVNRGDLTEHFNRREFACKCGCGFNDVDPKLAALCETIRRAAGCAVMVNSGCRCDAHNKRVGGASGSQHRLGKAADLSCSLGVKALFELIQGLYAKGELPGLEYCIRYPTFVHIDIGPKRSQRFVVKG